MTRMPVLTPGFFRLSLACIVVMHHLSRFELGKMAVFVFFVLSGYWISHMYETKYVGARRPYAVFLVSRFWRLAPVFLLVNALVIATNFIYGTLTPAWPWSFHQVASNLTMAGYASLTDTMFLVPAWSLDVEHQFYLIAPFLLILCARPDAVRRALLFAVCAAGPALLIVGPQIADGTVLPYLGFFALGAMAARGEWRPTAGQAAASIVIATGLALVICAIPETRGALLVGTGSDANVFWLNVPANALLALLLAPAALWTVRQRSGSTDRMLGDLSYVVYLLHWEAVFLVTRYLVGLPFLERAISTAAVVAATSVFAWLIWRFFDRPIDRMRSAWVQRRMLFASSPARSPVPAE